jgi:hypothetical protein
MYFFHIFNNLIIKLPDCPTQLSTTLDDIINLLNARGDLAIKQSSGTLAEGFTKLSYKNDQYFINDRTCDLDRVQKFLNDLVKSGDYIITEYLFPSNQIGKIWNESPNTLRLMVIRLQNCEPELVRAYWRFGSKFTGVVDNPAVGGIISNVDVLTGKFCSGSRYDGDILVACNVHPDTNVPIEGSIENWAFLKQKVLEICRYIPDVCYLGFDVIITENGFRIIEINSHQGIKYLQHFEPLLVNTTCNDFFLTQIERKKKRFNRNYRRRYSNY